MQTKFKLPADLQTGTSEHLWVFVADTLIDILCEHQIVPEQQSGEHEKLPLAFTFSYPVTQANIWHGVLQRWTKGLDISGVEGHDVVAQLEKVLQEKGIPVRIVAHVNDTAGVLMASAHKNPDANIGGIFGTGCNAAYMEQCSAIPKNAHLNLSSDATVAVNCEYGAFDTAHEVLPRASVDLEVDRDSARPGQQIYEKLIAGKYLCEILRRLLAHFMILLVFLQAGILGICDNKTHWISNFIGDGN